MEGELEHAPLNVPVVEIGYSTEPMRRLQEHFEHESSNYLMNLAEALFEYEFQVASGCNTMWQTCAFGRFKND